jgi:hypothetical protein
MNSRTPPAHRLAAWSGPVAGASFAGGVAAALALSDAPYPRPGAAVEDVQRYFRGSARAARISIAGQTVSAISLATFTASVAALASRSGRSSRPLRAAALAGGALAGATLWASALGSAALTGHRGDRTSSARSLHRLVFIAGGPAHGVGLGLLVGSLGIAGLRTGELPRPLAMAGLASAAANVLSPVSLAATPLMPLIPLGRFSGLVVSGIAGARLARRAR